jgi:hypothetical protein
MHRQAYQYHLRYLGRGLKMFAQEFQSRQHRSKALSNPQWRRSTALILDLYTIALRT